MRKKSVNHRVGMLQNQRCEELTKMLNLINITNPHQESRNLAMVRQTSAVEEDNIDILVEPNLSCVLPDTWTE